MNLPKECNWCQSELITEFKTKHIHFDNEELDAHVCLVCGNSYVEVNDEEHDYAYFPPISKAIESTEDAISGW